MPLPVEGAWLFFLLNSVSPFSVKSIAGQDFGSGRKPGYINGSLPVNKLANKPTDMKKHIHQLSFIPAFLLLVVLAQPLMAQDQALHDPLKNPSVWEKIIEDHKNKALWGEYFGKKWSELTDEQCNQVYKWQNIIAIEIIAQREAVFEMGVEEEQQEAQPEDSGFWEVQQDNRTEKLPDDDPVVQQNIFFQQMEEMFMQEPTILAELKGNITANFDIIEDVMMEEYMDLGADYVYYSTVHPDGKYNQELWVHERTEELKYLKKKELDKRKAELTASGAF